MAPDEDMQEKDKEEPPTMYQKDNTKGGAPNPRERATGKRRKPSHSPLRHSFRPPVRPPIPAALTAPLEPFFSNPDLLTLQTMCHTSARLLMRHEDALSVL